MNEAFTKKILEMISNMKEDELKQNLEKVSKVLGNTDTEKLVQKLKDEDIIK